MSKICPKCGLRGSSDNGGHLTTDMAVRTFRDEAGNWHEHDPNWKTETLRCRNGHSFTNSYKLFCYVKDCEWNEKLSGAAPKEGGRE